MTTKFLSPETAVQLLDLLRSRTPPPRKITKQEKRIETATVVAEKSMEQTGHVDQFSLEAIVDMKLELDLLYAKWAGELKDS
jgi:hypothetical protein